MEFMCLKYVIVLWKHPKTQTHTQKKEEKEKKGQKLEREEWRELEKRRTKTHKTIENKQNKEFAREKKYIYIQAICYITMKNTKSFPVDNDNENEYKYSWL